MSTIATLVVKVRAEITDFEKGMASLERQWGRVGDKLQAIGSKLTTAVTLPLAGVGIAATKVSIDFETAMTKIQTLASESSSNMQGLRESVLALAPTVGIGPQALAEGLLVIESTGFRGSEALKILEVAAKSSAIGLGDTKDVARALTSVISAYGAENITAAQAADILFNTVDVGAAEADQLASELGRVVGVAAELKVPFAEVGAAIATYTRLGLTAAEATTGFGAILRTILDPSAQARDALAGLGLSAQELRDQVASDGLQATLTSLKEALHGDADATAALFGNVRGLAAMLGITGAQAQAYAANLDTITNRTGILNERFKIWEGTTAATWSKFVAGVQVAAVALGDQLAPSFSRVVNAAMPLVAAFVQLVKGFANLPPAIQTTAIALMAVAAATGPIAWGFGSILKAGSALFGLMRLTGLAGVLGSIAEGVSFVAAGFTGALGGVGGFTGALEALVVIAGGPVTVAIGAVVAGIALLLTATGSWGTAWSIVKDVAMILVDLLVIAAKWVGNLAVAIGGPLVDALKSSAQWIASWIPDWVKGTLNWFEKKIHSIREKLDEIRGVGDLGIPNAPGAPKIMATPLALASGTVWGSGLPSGGGAGAGGGKAAAAALKPLEALLATTTVGFKNARVEIDALTVKIPDLAGRTSSAFNLMSTDLEIVGLNLSDVGQTSQHVFDHSIPATHQWTDGVEELSRAFSHLAQISGGSFGGIVQEIGNIVAATDLAAKSAEQFGKAQGLMGKATALMSGAAAVGQATGSGSTLGRMAGGAMSGAAMGSAFGPWGTAIGAGVGALVGLARGLANNAEKQINPVREAFVQAAGGLAMLNEKAFAATGNLTLVQNLLAAKNAEQYKIAIDALSGAFEFQKTALDTLQQTAQKYGFTIEELGPAFARQQLSAQAATLFQDFQVLNAGGIESAAILTRMSDNVNAFVQGALRTGTEVPAAMIPMLNQFAAAGLLIDQNGVAITDLTASGLTFSTTMTAGFKSVVDSVTLLTQTIATALGITLPAAAVTAATGITTAFQNVHISIPIDFDVADRPQFDFGGPQMAEGGIVRTPTIAMIGEAGPEAVVPLDQLGITRGGGIKVTVNVNAPYPSEGAWLRSSVTKGVLEGISSNKNGAFSDFEDLVSETRR